ncbi:MAG: ATP-binding protein [Blastochloris sp.]|nr:ATP-binding protein [Blastochloris sp.]
MESHLLLESHLKALRLPAFVQNYHRFAQDAIQTQQSYERFLLALAEQEVNQRELNRQRQCLKAARLPLLKELADFDFSAIPNLNKQRVLDLARGEYIRQALPLILVGNPGLGKTHIATGLAVAACRQGYRVRFYNTAALVNDLLQAQQQQRLPKFLAMALKHNLIVLDELGFIPFSTAGAQLMFQFCSTLYERVALLVTTNLKFADWTQVFGSEQLTGALLDRLTHRAHIIEFTGESFRFRQRLQQEDPKFQPSA